MPTSPRPTGRTRPRCARFGRVRLAVVAGAAAATLLAAGNVAATELPAPARSTAATAASTAIDPLEPGADSAPVNARVVIHAADLTRLHGFNRLDECHNAPEDAHTIFNLGEKDVVLYADDRCGVPLATVGSGFGSHVAPGQSFSAVKGDLDLAPFATTARDAVQPGKVTIFEYETTKLSAFDNLDRCHNAPALAHTIANVTNREVTLFADDRCRDPLVPLEAGSGSHVAPGQSFQATDAADGGS